MTLLPEWMRAPEASTFAVTGVPRKRNPVRKALGDFARVMADSLLDRKTAEHHGLLQSLDARVKVLGLIGLIVITTLLHRIPTLLLAYVLCFALALFSQLPARRYLGVWLWVPLLSALVMLPATLNIVTPGDPLWTVWRFADGHTLAVTDAGVYVVGRLVLRSAVCIALAVLLTSTTPSHRLFFGLRALGVPQLFIMLLAMMERYLTVLLRVAEELHLGRLSRSVLTGDRRQERVWVAAGMGTLFRRTQALGGSVYLAMLSRGYTGEVRLLDEPRWHTRDVIALAALLGIGLCLLLAEQVIAM